jgi:hypothetical protein
MLPVCDSNTQLYRATKRITSMITPARFDHESLLTASKGASADLVVRLERCATANTIARMGRGGAKVDQ